MKKISREQIELLESKANEAYQVLLEAINSKERNVISQAFESYGYFEMFVGDTAVALLGIGTNIRAWNRGTNESNLLDRYLLQAIIGTTSSGILNKTGYTDDFRRRFPDLFRFTKNLQEICAIIDDKSGKVPYYKIIEIAAHMSIAGRYDLVLEALNYIRKNYKKPII